MTKKVLNKVCIDCVNSNKHIKIGAEFKVGVEFGACDCCGKRYMIVPFGRFFDDKVELRPCTEEKPETEEEVEIKEKKKDALIPRIKELENEKAEHIKLIRELQDKVGALETAIQVPVFETKKPKQKEKDEDDSKNNEMFK